MARAGTAVIGATPAVPGDISFREPARHGRRRPMRTAGAWRSAVAAYLAYQAISLVLWWHLLGHFGSALPAGSADPGQEVWFLAWLPHALGSGTDPFFSQAIFAPYGVNLFTNTSTALIGILLAPVTVTAGPVASLDVAAILAPALSALAAFVLCRRHVSWVPAAAIGGLCYGFGPFLAGELRYAHLDLTWLVFPPLVFGCLDALLLARTKRPLLVGAALGVIVVAQFFVSTELLAITAIAAVIGVLGYALVRPRLLAAALRASGGGVALAACIAVAALAYPTYLVAAGARHVSGPVWPHIGQIATSLAATVAPHAELASVAFVSGSNGSYLGVGLVAVLLAGGVVLWRCAVLRTALALALAAYVCSLGYDLHVGHARTAIGMPAALLSHVPLLDSIVPERFDATVDLFCGLALAVVVDHVRRWERPVPGSAVALGDGATIPDVREAGPACVVLSLAVAAFALFPIAANARWPYATSVLSRPAVLAPPSVRAWSGASHAATTPTVVVYPDSSSAVADEMVWQAQDGFDFSLPDGYAIVPGPRDEAVESPPIDALWLVFAGASVGRLHNPLSATTRAAVRADLRVLGVRAVVVLPHARGSAVIEEAMRAVLGHPTVLDGADLWRLP